MLILRELKHEDYDDVLEICKDIWDGTDYLPSIFHSWIEDKEGLFIAAVDSDTNKVVGTNKYSILADGTGWLEGIRVHKDYRGKKIGKHLTERVLAAATKDLQDGKIQKIAFSTHVTNVESITMMKKFGFYKEQQHIIVQKDINKLDLNINKSDFVVKPWDTSYQEFANLPFTAGRNGIFHIAFCFQKPTLALYNYLKEHDCFVNINGYNGIYLYKGEPHFVTEVESFQAIDTFMNYYSLILKNHSNGVPLFSITEGNKALIESLKAADYTTWTDWQSDYYYFVKK